MDTKKLRQKILDLAIRGKLVPQDPNDEPASVLLERIRAEKERLIKEGKIKRSKKTAEDDKIETPFEIPDSWEWCKLGNVIKLKSGESIKIRSLSDNSKYPVYGGNGINGYFDNYNVEAETLIIGRVGFYCGSVHKTESKAWVTDNALIVTCDKTLFSIDYLRYAMLKLNLSTTSNSTAQPVVSGKGIYPLLFPLPPVAEQKRIANEVERWFTLIDELESNEDDLLKAIDKAKSKILDLAIHGKLVPQDPNDEPAIELLKRINPKFEPCDEVNHIPDNWINCRIQDVFKIAMGSSPTGESLNRNGDGIEFHQGKLSFTELYLGLSDIYTTQSVKLASPNSILLCVRAPVGVVNITEREVCIGRGLCSLAPMNAINLMYGLYVLQTCQKDFEQKATGSTFKAIGGDVIKNHIIPLPPYNEQLRIVSKIEEAFKALDALS